ncbi:phosphoadenosine phosphosulfate reductase family protein, partial [Desulfovirgula thermocuniculi]|uniref:phosphoadenosine phosphosulfate reductase domain-containing protein n=1 Tax=Desulfovirgula thermocuniculi TaxID=348842 RepID=UPI001B7FB452
ATGEAALARFLILLEDFSGKVVKIQVFEVEMMKVTEELVEGLLCPDSPDSGDVEFAETVARNWKADFPFLLFVDYSKSFLEATLERGYTHWVVTFSGGKDSTTVLILALEVALSGTTRPDRIDVVYADTGVEIPAIREYALSFLDYLKNFPRIKKLPIHYHVVTPCVEESFWVCLLGKGYPPPHQRFRWCTRRLKIEPVENALRSVSHPRKTAVLTGVRVGESANRNIGLYRSCRRGGECGQGAWLNYSSRLGATYLAPIFSWSECSVWDFLQLYAPLLGYPTGNLEESVYNGRETRFGCWVCTVVRQDRAMEKITTLPRWNYLKPLLEFRQKLKDLGARPDLRVLRPDGKPGRLKLSLRKQLLSELLEIQEKLGLELLSQQELQAIQKCWKRGFGDVYRTRTTHQARAGKTL